MSRIATGTGDKGTTGLFDGTRVAKTHPLIAAFGDVDELDAAIGVAATVAERDAMRHTLQRLQQDLFALKTDLATPLSAPGGPDRVTQESVALLDRRIDELEGQLPVLKRFILYGGTPCASHLQLARAVARRAERAAWAATEGGTQVNPQALVYLNRLSDYLFLLARLANRDAGQMEEEMRLPGKA
ncbi:MAG TPA: cob(I)yrinic acid a,c-diamide adenosyltransferase [Candidatus Thermoplasmatota archaeon]